VYIRLHTYEGNNTQHLYIFKKKIERGGEQQQQQKEKEK
jgi:hypothetical protein